MKILYYRHNKHQKPDNLRAYQIDFSELTLIYDGELQYVIDHKKYVLRKNDLIYIPAGSFRERKTSQSAHYVSFNIREHEETSLFTMHNGVSNAVKYIIAACDEVREYTTDFSDERYVLLLKCLFKQLEMQRNSTNANPLVVKIKEYIKKNLDKKITLSDIANYTFFSPVYCEEIFKKEMHMPIIDYVIDLRIKEAQFMLITENSSLKVIAEKVGFFDYNYFSRIFKQRVGMTPSEYRATPHSLRGGTKT